MREDEEGEIGGAGERRGLLTRSRENGGARKVSSLSLLWRQCFGVSAE